MDLPTITVYPDLLAETAAPSRGILSQTLSNADGVELVLFAFAAGEALAEHTSSRPAIIHVLAGEGDLTVGDEAHAARPGPGSACRPTAGTASRRARRSWWPCTCWRWSGRLPPAE